MKKPTFHDDVLIAKSHDKRIDFHDKRIDFLEMQLSENISNIDKIYKILERLEKRLDLLQPRGIGSSP